MARLQEEQAKCTALEMSLQQERQRVRALEQAAGSTGKLAGKNGFSTTGSSQGSHGAQQASDAHDQGSEDDIAVARMVAGSVGRAAGRAEAQMELEAALQQKERELSRLRDKLQYWERMNQEMSQQNTQAIGELRSMPSGKLLRGRFYHARCSAAGSQEFSCVVCNVAVCSCLCLQKCFGVEGGSGRLSTE